LESIRSVCQDAEGWMWATLQDGSLARGKGRQWRAVTAADGWRGGNAVCVTAGRDGGVWVGTRERGLQHWRAGQWQEWGRREGLTAGSVRSLLHASNGDLWVAADSPNRLHRFRQGAFQTLNLREEVRSLRALAEGADGTIWVGSSDGQILRVEGNALVPEPAVREERLRSVRTLHTTADGSLWIGYAGWGVGRLAAGRYTRFTTAAGLPDEYISQILSDAGGRIWFAGNRGLFQVAEAELSAVAEGRAERVRALVYGRSEGLPSFQFMGENSPTAWRTAAGELWFATRNGLVVVQPDRIQDNSTPPPVMLERVMVDDRVVALRDSQSPLRGSAEGKLPDLRLRHAPLPLLPGHRKIEFEFAALSFTSPENVHFRYRMENFDQQWIEAGMQRGAKYPQLPPGRYEFRVQACNNAGVWNEAGAGITLTVAPFFWQTWWFRLGVMGSFTATIIGLVRYFSFRRLRRQVERLERQAELQRERTRIARDLHDEVGSKLSRLSLLSEMASHQPGMPDGMHAEVSEISETARDTIRSFEEILWMVNPKYDSLAELVHYLCRFAEDLFDGSATECRFDLPEKIPAPELTTELRHHVYLAAREALNNVLKHARARRVCLRLRLVEGGFALEIEDDGAGFAPDAVPSGRGSGNGLENMRERMRLAGGAFMLRSGPGEGTCVTLEMRSAEPVAA
jgi:signal transduction histidine kinase